MDNKSSKNRKALIAIIIIIVVIAAVAVAYSVWSSSNKKAETKDEVTTVDITEQTTIDTTEQATISTTEPTTEKTTSPTVKTTTQLKLEKIKNVKVENFDVRDPDGGGFLGVMISFAPVTNADGYRIKYTYEYGEKPEENYQNIDASHTKLYYGSQQGPTKIEARAYNKSDSGTVYGEWVTIYNTKDYDFNNLEEIDGNKWDKMVKDYYEIEPFNNDY